MPTEKIKKHLRAHGGVALAVEAGESRLTFQVKDTGVGLTAQELEWIRIPFAQTDGGTTRRNSGIGLALPLASRLIKAMGGELNLRGEPHQGLTANFTIPARPILADLNAVTWR